jgi:hypothetical protein
MGRLYPRSYDETTSLRWVGRGAGSSFTAILAEMMTNFLRILPLVRNAFGTAKFMSRLRRGADRTLS